MRWPTQPRAPDAPAVGRVDPAFAAKRFATLQARAALAGATLYQSADDHGREHYMVSHLALTRELPSLDQVEHWLGLVTGTSA